MQYASNIIFLVSLVIGIGLFIKSLKRIYRNIKLGLPVDRTDQPKKRWAIMASVALGQSKMNKRPIAGFLHLLVYVGFIIVNIEFIEILIDGLFGTHRILSSVLGNLIYSSFTAILEIMALLVVLAVVLFFIRRNVLRLRRFNMKEMLGWPQEDANWILLIELTLMCAFFMMNATDLILQARDVSHYNTVGYFPISEYLLKPLLEIFRFDSGFLVFLERASWWVHLLGILFFLNYLSYSKHLHILFAFPNTWFSNLRPKGELDNLASVTKEIKLMMDPNSDPYAPMSENQSPPAKFGAEDIFDLNQVQLLNAYTCTECGRCTDSCPANLTGKKLSPRKIMMATRDRVEEVGRNINKNGKFIDDGKKLLDDYISREELWACTTCNACVEACPILIDPLSIIIEMRRFLVMEQSAAPQGLNLMMTNIENNAAPWQYNQADRLNWVNEN